MPSFKPRHAFRAQMPQNAFELHRRPRSAKTAIAPIKMAPIGSGPFIESRRASLSRDALRWKSALTKRQRPIRGRSPLRIAIRAFAISTRSTKARNRPKIDGESGRALVALGVKEDIWFSLVGAGQHLPASFEREFRYTRCQIQQTCLHSSNMTSAVQHGHISPLRDRKGRPEAAF